MRKNHSKIVCIKLVHLPYLVIIFFGFLVIIIHKSEVPKRVCKKAYVKCKGNLVISSVVVAVVIMHVNTS